MDRQGGRRALGRRRAGPPNGTGAGYRTRRAASSSASSPRSARRGPARTAPTSGPTPRSPTPARRFKPKIVPQLLKNEVGMCLLYSEPGAGSDLAGIRTRAEHVGDHYVVNGSKVWTSGAATADYGMLIARTDWDVPKHKGISFFFLPMKQPGVEVRPLRQITGESHFNEVFFTDAICPEENLLGPAERRLGRAADRARLRALGDGRRRARATQRRRRSEGRGAADRAGPRGRRAGRPGDPPGDRQGDRLQAAQRPEQRPRQGRPGAGRLVVDHEPRQAGDEPHPARGSAGADDDPGRRLACSKARTIRAPRTPTS